MTPAGPADASLPDALAPLAAVPARTALFLDFDGTLAAIVADPRDARPLPGVPALLADLAAEFELVAVVSGRPTSFLAEALGPPKGVVLAGLYGLERALNGQEHDAWAHVIDEVVAEAEATAPPGVYVEPKGLTVTLHWRRAPEQKTWVVAFAECAAAEHDLLVHEGRHERELRPPVQVDKGTVV
ncbi:MAG TPA: trehalose-phosphatase, partial [Acidimicrobiales bacterium]|nr:trehalose-phosphatase [Acidimicrobiales bacterium]